MSAFAGALLLTIAFGAIALIGLPRRCAGTLLAVAVGICAIVAASLAIAGRELTWPGAVLLACAAVCAATDVETGYIFDRVLLATLVAIVTATWSPARLSDGSMAALVSAGALAVPFVLTRGRAMGLGDVKLAGTTAFALGLHASLDAMWFACVSGGGVAAAMLASGRAKRGARMPFGAFLAFGACATLFLGGVG